LSVFLSVCVYTACTSFIIRLNNNNNNNNKYDMDRRNRVTKNIEIFRRPDNTGRLFKAKEVDTKNERNSSTINLIYSHND